MNPNFPTAYAVLLALITVVAAATWFAPAGQYDLITIEELGREVPEPGTYQVVEANPQGVFEVRRAPIAGFSDPVSYDARAIDAALFVIVIGGFLGVVAKTGAIGACIACAMKRLEDREKWMIPILMGLFAVASHGTTITQSARSIVYHDGSRATQEIK